MATERIPGKPPGNVLLLQLGETGDAVLSTPAFRAVKETCPGARLSVLVRKPLASLLEADPCIDEIFEMADPGRKVSESWREILALGRRLRRPRPDLAIDLDGSGPGAVIARLSGAAVRVGRRDPGQPSWREWMFTRLPDDPPPSPPPAHPGGDRCLRLLRAVGMDTSDSVPRIAPPEGAQARVRELIESLGLRAEERWVTISPFSGGKHKEWAHDRWADVIGALRDRHGLAAIVVCTSGEVAAADRIVGRFGGRSAFRLAGRTGPGELAALLSLGEMHLGVDNGPSLLAAAVGVPVVTACGPSRWKERSVADATHRFVTADRACLACGRRGCADKGTSLCLEELDPAAVLRAAGEVLAGSDRG